jgi:site-specific recombinase XerD
MTDRQITPAVAAAEFVQSKTETTASTRDNLTARLQWFVEWCQNEAIETLDEIDGYTLQQYTTYLKHADALAPVTVENHVVTFRQLLRWCEKAELVNAGLSEKVIIPAVDPDDRARDSMITHERAQAIADYLAEFHWASDLHVVFCVFYHTGMRRSAAHGLDVEDWMSNDQYFKLRHRSDEGTRLKLGDEGARNVSIIDNRIASAIDGYIEHQRHDVEDDYGRNPLLTSRHGRLHYTTLTEKVYKITRPCFYSDMCPVEGREIDTCDAANYASEQSKCPVNVSPHDLRRSSITHSLSEGISKSIVSARASVSPEVLDAHYDARSVEQRRQNRREQLDALDDDE